MMKSGPGAVCFLATLIFSAPCAHVIADSSKNDCVEQAPFLNHNLQGAHLFVAPDARFALLSSASEEDQEDWTTQKVEPRSSQSPTAALLKSMVVPGWGQIGNRGYTKAGIVVAVEGVLFARWLHFRNQTVDARAEFEAIDDPTLRRQEFEEFEKLRNRRNLFGWLTGTAIFVSMIDAFVGAHLAGFPKKDSRKAEENSSLSFRFLPPGETALGSVANWRVGVRYRF